MVHLRAACVQRSLAVGHERLGRRGATGSGPGRRGCPRRTSRRSAPRRRGARSRARRRRRRRGGSVRSRPGPPRGARADRTGDLARAVGRALEGPGRQEERADLAQGCPGWMKCRPVRSPPSATVDSRPSTIKPGALEADENLNVFSRAPTRRPSGPHSCRHALRVPPPHDWPPLRDRRAAPRASNRVGMRRRLHRREPDQRRDQRSIRAGVHGHLGVIQAVPRAGHDPRDSAARSPDRRQGGGCQPERRARQVPPPRGGHGAGTREVIDRSGRGPSCLRAAGQADPRPAALRASSRRRRLRLRRGERGRLGPQGSNGGPNLHALHADARFLRHAGEQPGQGRPARLRARPVPNPPHADPAVGRLCGGAARNHRGDRLAHQEHRPAHAATRASQPTWRAPRPSAGSSRPATTS